MGVEKSVPQPLMHQEDDLRFDSGTNNNSRKLERLPVTKSQSSQDSLMQHKSNI